MIFDTDVLIWYFRGNQKAKEFISGIPYRDRQEVRTVKEFIRDNFPGVIHPDDHISEKAISLLELHAGPDGLRTIDALMAATALREDDTLATANHKHFKKIAGLDIRKFAP
jgi:hypothetical protein